MAETTPAVTHLIDEWVDLPEGSTPEKLHIFFDKNTREYADQYTAALQVARGIPFNISTVPVTDPLALVIARVFSIKDGNEAVMRARAYYEQWAYEATKHGWILALLEDNELSNSPTAYEPPKTPRGLPVIPEPRFDLTHPSEFRLKQIMDVLASDLTIQNQVMSKINTAFATLVQEAEETDKRTGFQPEPASTVVHVETVTSSDDSGKKPRNRSTKQIQSVDTGSMGKNTETTG